MKVLVEYRIQNAEGVDVFHEERKESELPKAGDTVVLIDGVGMP